MDALWDFLTYVLRVLYNKYHAHSRLKTKTKKYRKIIVEYGLWHLLSKNKTANNNVDNIDLNHELSTRQKRRYTNKMVQLVVNQDASIGIAQDFLHSFASRLINKNIYVQMHVKHLMTPLIVRDINTMLLDWKHDENRQIREAFALKSNNISTRKAMRTRKSV